MQHDGKRPQRLFQLLLFVLILVLVIIVAQPSSASLFLQSLAAPAQTAKVTARPGSSWFLTLASAFLLVPATYSAYRLEALSGQTCFRLCCMPCQQMCQPAGSGHAGAQSTQNPVLAFSSNPAAGSAFAAPPARPIGVPSKGGKSGNWRQMTSNEGDTCVGGLFACALTPSFLRIGSHTNKKPYITPPPPLPPAGTTLTLPRR